MLPELFFQVLIIVENCFVLNDLKDLLTVISGRRLPSSASNYSNLMVLKLVVELNSYVYIYIHF